MDIKENTTWKDDKIESLEVELYELGIEVDYLKSELNN